VRDLLNILEQAGFTDLSHLGSTPYATSGFTAGALFLARKPS